jgi:hypothetical protein
MVGAFEVMRTSNSVQRRTSRRLNGLGVAIALAVVVAGPASAWPSSDWSRAVSTLKRIHTVVGANAYDRMRACRVRFDRRRSWVEDAQLTSTKGKPGDLVLQVAFDGPKMRGHKTRVKDIIAQWYIAKSGLPTPWGLWADKIQNGDEVMGLHC